ncbi:MAG TPA: NAD(+)/NADH kinase [Ktedonobacterales bacterium]|jgi:NAD+ kinase
MVDPHHARAVATIRHVGIVYQEHAPQAVILAQTLITRLRGEGLEAWMVPSARESELEDLRRGTDVMLVLGGDGTILSVARKCAPEGTPIIGINFGRVGFLTELEPSEVEEQLGLYLRGDFWVDERAMLRAEVDMGGQRHDLLALNDIVLVRGAEPRVVRIRVWVDGHLYNTTVADGVIVSTATGSTAYNLAAGGPILHPQVRSAVVTPVAPHLAADLSLVLEPNATIALEVLAGSGGAVLSADGQINLDVPDGTQVSVTTNGSVTRFLRRRPPTHFYKVLSAKLKESL